MKRRTLLIVDDNDAFRGMLCSVLEMRGYITVPAKSAEAGLAIAQQRPIDAAFVDVEMSGMDGFEFAQALAEKDVPAGRRTPVWIMTGVLRPGLSRRAANVGAVLLLRKPLNLDATCAAIETEFARHR